MKIGIDTFGCEHGRSGLGSYLYSLVKKLPSDSEDTFELFGPEMDRFTYTSENPVEFKSVDIQDTLFSELFYHKFKVNKFALRQKYDAVLYAAAARMVPPKFKVPSAAVVNDVVSTRLKAPGSSWQKRQIHSGLKNADCIIVPSEYVKNDILSCGIKARRIEVIPNGIDHSLFYPDESLISSPETVDIKPFAIKKPYIIYASAMRSPEKRHVELIKAFSLFKEKTSSPHRLVIAGSDGACSEKVHKTAFESKYASDIFITGYFPHQNFPELYRGADACVFPAENEGVGLPVLEAMSTGIPVACSKSGSLPEIAGDAALYFDSTNIEEMALCIEKIVTDREFKASLIKKGTERSALYSWKKTALKTVEVIHSLK